MHSSRLQSLFKRLINQFKTFCCCLLTAGPQSKCGHCYCKQASKTRYVPCIQERFTERCCIFMRRVTTFSYSKLLSPTSNNQTHNTSPSSPPLPSVFTSLCPSWHGVFVSLVLWQLGSCGVQLTFLSSRIPPRGRPHLSESLTQCEGTGQMQDPADGGQARGRTTSTPRVTVQTPTINVRMNSSENPVCPARKVTNLVEEKPRRLVRHQRRSCRVIEFGSKTFMSFRKV